MYWILAAFWITIGTLDVHTAIAHQDYSWGLILAFVQMFGGLIYACWMSGLMKTQRMWRTKVKDLESSRDWLRQTNDKWMGLVEDDLLMRNEHDAAKVVRIARDIVASHTPIIEEEGETYA